MLDVVTWLVVALCAALAGWAGYRAARDRPVILRQLIVAGVVEAVLLLQVVLVAVLLARGAASPEPATLWGYVLTVLLVLPVAAAWAFLERTRWSSVVLLVAALVTAFLQYRILVVWTA